MRAQPVAPHFDVAHRSELGSEPAQIGAQLGCPVGIDELLERGEIRAQAPRRDARLVHRLGIVAAAQIGFVLDQALVRVGDRGGHDLGHGDLASAHDISHPRRQARS